MAGNYNRNTYNSALYNAGRSDAGALIRSIISAHTGPHIKAIVGGDPTGSPEAGDGLSLISDFSIQEGKLKKPPAGYFFPDLSARVDAVRSQLDNLLGFIRAVQFKDLPASIFLVTSQPDLPAALFALAQKDLSAFLFGELAKKDLPASIFVAVDNLAGQILGIAAPRLRGRIFVQPPGNLGAIIWSPTDLAAQIAVVEFEDLAGDIRGFGFKNLAGQMLGVATPKLFAFLRGFASQESDLLAKTVGRTPGADQLSATIAQSFGNTPTGPGSGLPANILGGFDVDAGSGTTAGVRFMPASIRHKFSDSSSLRAFIGTGGESDLGAVIDFLGADNVQALITAASLSNTSRDLSTFMQPVNLSDISASMSINENVKFLAASIAALADTADLGAFIRVAETFVTAIYNIITFGARNLRATIGNPACEGGSASANLRAFSRAQSASNLEAFIESFLETDLGAVVNTNSTFRAIDFISVKYSSRPVRNKKFLASDSISVVYSPFRGATLSAAIMATPPESSLSATITATFLPSRVAPSVSVLTNADLRLGEELNIQQIRLQLEGSLSEYFYVNGTENSFIRDPNQQWRLNIRSFRPIAENLFGDFAAGRVCRLGSLKAFNTIDEAIRFCISAVIGLEGQENLSAAIVARGGTTRLPAILGVSDTFGDISAVANRVFPSDFPATITAVPIGMLGLSGLIRTTAPGTLTLIGSVTGYDHFDLGVVISGIP